MAGAAVLCDIGGTNARFALAGAGGLAEGQGSATVLPVARFASFAEALAAYLAEARVTPEAVAVSAAGPVVGGAVRLTNAPWTISADAIRQAWPGARVVLMNDLEAVARALPGLGDGDVATVLAGKGAAGGDAGGTGAAGGDAGGMGVGGTAPADQGGAGIGPDDQGAAGGDAGATAAAGTAPEDRGGAEGGEAGGLGGAGGANAQAHDAFPRIAVNVGTGFGAALAVPVGRGAWRAVATEAGHISIDAGAFAQDGPVTLEEIVSGPGHARLKARLAPATAESWRPAYGRLFGRAVRDLVQATGAWGGAYLCGGLVDDFEGVFGGAAFAEGFLAPGPMAARLAAVPVYRITRAYPAFAGLAAALADERAT